MPLTPLQSQLTRLIEEASALAPVPAEAAAAYDQRRGTLIERVNAALADDAATVELIGANPVRMMLDNHRHHAEFMANVFRLQDPLLLATTLPWVYHTYTSQGFSPAYFPRALEEWMRAVRTHLDADHAAPIIGVYEWMLAHHDDVRALASGMEEQVPPVRPAWQRQQRSFLAALLAGDHRSCATIADEQVECVDDLRGLYLQLVAPSMYEIGDLWQQGAISIADEHMASAIVSRVMASQYPRFVELEHTRGRIVLSSAPNEFHEIGGRMMADLLEIDGWDVTYLGANTPADDLIALMRRARPHMLGLSVAMPFNIDRTMDTIAAIRDDPELRETYVLVGGRVFIDRPELRARIGADAWARDVEEGVALARDWWERRETVHDDES